MTLVSTIGPLAAYAAAFQTIVYLLLPRRHRTRWAPLVTGSVGAGVVVLAGSIFGFERIGLGSVDPGVVVFWTVITASVVSLVGLTMFAVPQLRSALADPRLAALSARESFVQIFVRIPVMTALIEEAVFRGVLHSALMALYPPAAAVWIGAALFGMWHIGPGLDQAESAESGTVAGWVHTLITVTATTVAGAALVWLRIETGSIWAGVAVHAALNMTMALFARRAGRSLTTTT
jgi:membrane protease YdiL (CAAX protease family)